jgi:hypothetical protein
MQSFCCRTPRAADSPETSNHSTNTPQIAQKVKKSTIRVCLTSKMLLSFYTFESTKPGNKSTLFPGLLSGFCTFESPKVQ